MTVPREAEGSPAQYRQGDVLLVQVRDLPRGQNVRRERGRLILARGERTGHAHAITDQGAELIEAKEGRFLNVLASRGVELTHEEHDPIRVPRGVYCLLLQREYAPAPVDRILPQRELRNEVGRVLREVSGGARFRVTVRGRPVADLVPVTETQSFVRRAEVERIIRDAPLDPAFLEDVGETVGATIDEL